jgi:cytoskeletal protein CcmA (bactofilin family)
MALFKTKQEAEPQPKAPVPPPPIAAQPGTRGEERRNSRPMANIGKSISIKGDVEGDEDTVIEGRVEGRVTLKNHHLTVGPNGDVQGEVSGRQVTIVGRVAGNVVASERIEVRESGQIQGDLIAPRLLVAEGALINGAITMKAAPAGAGAAKPPAPPAPKPQV